MRFERRGRGGAAPRLALLAPALAWLVSACASAGGLQVVALEEIRARPVRDGQWIGDHQTALVSIAAIMEQQLGLPRVQATLYFYPDREAFRLALEADGADPAFAEETAQTMAAVGGVRRVLLNNAELRSATWPSRIALLAHELTHTIQYELSGGRRSTSDQWVREGFADWVQAQVIDALGLVPQPVVDAGHRRRVRAAGTADRLPPIFEMATFRDWLRWTSGPSGLFTYPQAYLAVDLLIERHGLAALLDYFRRFAESDDRLAHFAAAFEEPSSFQDAFRVRLEDVFR